MTKLSPDEILAENERLTAENQQLKWKERQAQIARPLVSTSSAGGPRVELPTPSQKVALSKIVVAAFPWLSAASIYIPGSDWDDQFSVAFEALAHVNRTDTVDTRYYLAHWNDKIQNIARALRYFTRISNAPMISAALAWGDIPHNVGIDNNHSAVCCFGLADGGGRPPNAAGWKAVLEKGKLLPPTSTAQPRKQSYSEYITNKHRPLVSFPTQE